MPDAILVQSVTVEPKVPVKPVAIKALIGITKPVPLGTFNAEYRLARFCDGIDPINVRQALCGLMSSIGDLLADKLGPKETATISYEILGKE